MFVQAVAIELVSKRLQEMAILSARAELQRLMLAAAQQQQPQTPTSPEAGSPPLYTSPTFI